MMFTRKSKLIYLLILLVILFIIGVVIFFFKGQTTQKSTQITPTPTPQLEKSKFPMVKVVNGFVMDIKPDYINIQESTTSGKLTPVFIDDKTTFIVQTISTPSKKTSTGSATILYTIDQTKEASLSAIKINDEVNITLAETLEKDLAKTITILRKK